MKHLLGPLPLLLALAASAWAQTAGDSANMQMYKDQTKRVYDERLAAASNEIKKLEEAEKAGGPLIPQGTVIYNATGRKLTPRITGKADASWIGVYAPVQERPEGQQKLYTYDATAFGATVLSSKDYIVMGTPHGAAYFNVPEGYLEWVVTASSTTYHLGKKGEILFNSDNFEDQKKNLQLPDQFKYTHMLMKYDVEHDWNFGFNLGEGSLHLYSIYSNLSRIFGFRYEDTRAQSVDKLFAIRVTNDLNLSVNRLYPGSLVVISNKVYLSDILQVRSNVIYIYIDDLNALLGKDSNKMRYFKNWKCYYIPPSSTKCNNLTIYFSGCEIA